MMMETYNIWKRSHFDGAWSKTAHSVKARTDKEAQSRLVKKFSECGFSSMSLMAIPHGKTPTGTNPAD